MSRVFAAYGDIMYVGNLEDQRTEPGPVFDGRPWFLSPSGQSTLLTMLTVYVAKKARDGDADAAALLTAFQVRLDDNDSKPYWPREESK